MIVDRKCHNYHRICEDEKCYCTYCQEGDCEICEKEGRYNVLNQSTYCPPFTFEQLWSLPEIS